MKETTGDGHVDRLWTLLLVYCRVDDFAGAPSMIQGRSPSVGLSLALLSLLYPITAPLSSRPRLVPIRRHVPAKEPSASALSAAPVPGSKSKPRETATHEVDRPKQKY